MSTARPTPADLAATTLYTKHGKSLHWYAQQLIGDRQRGEDLVQEALLRAWLHADRLIDDDTARRRWLYRVVHNAAVDEMRAQSVRPAGIWADLDAVPADGDVTDQILTRIDVMRALRQLKAEHRSVLVEIFYGGRTAEEAALSLGIPHGTAKSRLFYGLRHLRRLLGGSRFTSVAPAIPTSPHHHHR